MEKIPYQFQRVKDGRDSYLMSPMKAKDYKENDFLHQLSDYKLDNLSYGQNRNIPVYETNQQRKAKVFGRPSVYTFSERKGDIKSRDSHFGYMIHK